MGPYILSGLVLGSISAVSVLGLVLTYSSSRVFNFAHGAMAYFIAVLYWWLTDDQGWSVWPAAIVSVLVVAPLLGLFLWAIVFRRLTHATPVVRFVSTVGLWVAIPALARIIFPIISAGSDVQTRGLGGTPPGQFDVLGVTVNWNQATVIIGAAAVAVGFTILMRFTPLGLMTRAAVDSPRVAAIAGINPSAITAISWMLGTMLAGLAGVLLSPLLGISEIQFTLLLVVSLAAAVLGRMTSIPLAFGGAMAIGMIQGLSEKWESANLGFVEFSLDGFKPSVPFVLMLIALLAYQGLRREQFEVDLRAGPTEEEVAPAARLTGWKAAIGPIAVALVLLSVPIWLNDFWIGVVSQGVALGVLFLTFTVVTGEGGMVSLAQVSLAGIGAFTAAKLATDAEWPVWLALLAGGAVAVPIGLLLAGLTLRLGGLYLALGTLAFSQLLRFTVFGRDDFDNFGSGVAIDRPEFLGIDFSISGGRDNFYYLLVIVFMVAALVVVNLRRSTTGLVLTAMRSSEQAAATTGISILRSKLIAFGTSAFIAGLGGGLFAVSFGRATNVSFEVLVGIVWLAIVVTWGVRSVLGALMAGILYVVVSPPTDKLSFIFVIIVVFAMMGETARLIGSKAIYTARGALLGVGVLAVGITAIVLLLPVEIELSEKAKEVPTLLFGLGAVFLARQPRGVLFDVMNRIRLRQLQRERQLADGATAEAAT
ncbi:MAG: hypothetical protein FJW86_08535 [Actinobacteria bacterium]|nr:hypothetical protein [Actinomycetota bacterium]